MASIGTSLAYRREDFGREDFSNDRIDPVELSDLIGDIYDAALAPDRWPLVLREVREFIDGMGAALYAKDVSGAGGAVFHTDGRMDLEWEMKYFQTYGKIDPTNSGHVFAEVEQDISTSDILDYDEFLQSRFYLEWARPQGIVDILNAPLEKRGSWAALFGVFRHERHGRVDERMRNRMRLVLPHIRRSVLVGRVIEEGAVQAANLTDALDGLSAGMFLVDADGRIMHTNAAGTTLLGRRDVLVMRNGRLTAQDRQAAAALQDVFTAAGRGDRAVGIKGISVTLPSADNDNHVAHVLPLTSGERTGTGANYRAVAALFVQPAAFEAPAAPEVIAKAYGLTLSELRVMVTIVQAGGVAETADALGVAETTVKTHLSRLFQKTGAARQADLVKLMAGYQSPLVR